MFGYRLLAVLGVVAPLAACTPATTESGSSFVPRADGTGHAASPASKSWIEPAAKRGPLLYVSNDGAPGVTIYANTGGDSFALVGELFGFRSPGGECVDGKGNVFVTDTPAKVTYEYARGTILPKAVVPDPDGEPYACSIDPKSGRLAVSNFEDPNGAEPGNVVVYPSLTGTPQQYADPHLNIPLFCAFDRKGNLYVSALDSSYHGVLSELPKNASIFTIFTVTGGSINEPTGVLWHGSQLLVGDLYDPKTSIRQISISGSTANIVGTVPLANTQEMGQFPLFGSGSSSVVIVPDFVLSTLQIYSYPGGTLVGSIAGGLSEPFGAVISD